MGTGKNSLTIYVIEAAMQMFWEELFQMMILLSFVDYCLQFWTKDSFSQKQ